MKTLNNDANSCVTESSELVTNLSKCIRGKARLIVFQTYMHNAFVEFTTKWIFPILFALMSVVTFQWIRPSTREFIEINDPTDHSFVAKINRICRIIKNMFEFFAVC